MPITSPVERISGLSIILAPGKRANGKTDSLTAQYGGIISFVNLRSLSFSPAITRAASLASGIPIALETNGTVREARGFTSIIKSSSSFIAYCIFINPTTCSSRASAWVALRTFSKISLESV